MESGNELPHSKMRLTPVEGRHGERLVDGAAAFQFAGKDDDFIHAGDAAHKIGVLPDDLAQFVKAVIAAHTAKSQMRPEAAILLTITKSRQGKLNRVVQGDQLFLPAANAQPDRTRPSNGGKRAGAMNFDFKRRQIGHGGGHRIANRRSIEQIDLAQEFER